MNSVGVAELLRCFGSPSRSGSGRQTGYVAQALCPVVVGREDELRALERAVDDVAQARGGAVALTGPAGVGKSRLVREVFGRATRVGLPVMTGRAVSTSSATSYGPVSELWFQFARRAPVPAADESLRPCLSVLEAIAPRSPSRTQPVESTVSPPQVGDALMWLFRTAFPAGVVVVFEDLHWADPETVAVVDYLADTSVSEAVLCVVTVRDERRSAALDLVRRLRGRAGMTHLRLTVLTQESTLQMVRACTADADPDLLNRVLQAAEGIPLFVEELLASPGLPQSFAQTVSERLDDLMPSERTVVEAAAVLGRDFDWTLLPAVSGESGEVVARALARAVDRLLVVAEGDAFRFRHALTREAVLDSTLPPRQRSLAEAALAAMDSTAAQLHVASRAVLADVALRAGDRHRAGRLLEEAGRDALRIGALSTAIDALRRSADLLNPAARAEALLTLVEALAAAGRVDEAVAAAAQVTAQVGDDPAGDPTRLQVHLCVAAAATEASRWELARHQFNAARELAASGAEDGAARVDVLDAELALAADDYDRARTLAEAVAGSDVAADLRCRAWEIVGRCLRSADLAAARRAFETGLAMADANSLPIMRLRALHELGTIDLFDHAGTERLLEARTAAEAAGATSTVAVLDLQLGAGYTGQWDLDRCDEHCRRAIAAAERLQLRQVRAKALAMLAGTASMRADPVETERLLALCRSASPDDPMLDGFGWGSRGLCLLLAGDATAALETFARGVTILSALPHAEPAALRAVWPVLLASRNDRRARAAVDEARRLHVDAFNPNSGLLLYAEAIIAGRADRERANGLARRADRAFVNSVAWQQLAQFLATPAAITDGWGDPQGWLMNAEAGFASRGLPKLASQCRDLAHGSVAAPWGDVGITNREADVLALLVEGLANKQIAARLHLSPRTVEKHVESLLRKTGARSRTELAVASAGARAT